MCVHFMPNEDDVTDFSTPSEIVFIVLMLFVIFGFVVVCAIEHVIVGGAYTWNIIYIKLEILCNFILYNPPCQSYQYIT